MSAHARSPARPLLRMAPRRRRPGFFSPLRRSPLREAVSDLANCISHQPAVRALGAAGCQLATQHAHQCVRANGTASGTELDIELTPDQPDVAKLTRPGRVPSGPLASPHEATPIRRDLRWKWPAARLWRPTQRDKQPANEAKMPQSLCVRTSDARCRSAAPGHGPGSAATERWVHCVIGGQQP